MDKSKLQLLLKMSDVSNQVCCDINFLFCTAKALFSLDHYFSSQLNGKNI